MKTGKSAYFGLVLFAAFLPGVVRAAGVTSVASGPWSAAGTWSGGAVPAAGDSVTIAGGTTVTLDTLAAAASTTTVNGTLYFSRSASSTLALTGGNMTVGAAGKLDMGSPADPISAGVNATIILALASGPSARYSLTINNGGTFTMYGAPKSAVATAAADVLAGATGLTVPLAGAAGWAVGDAVTIGQTEGNATLKTEQRVISSTAAAGPNLQVTWSGALSYDHFTTSIPVRVADLTRNVLIRSSGTNVNADTAVFRSVTQPASKFQAVFGEFAYLGAPGLGVDNLGLVFEAAGAQGAISSCTVRNGYDGIVSNGASNNVFTGNLVYANADKGVYFNGGTGNTVSNSDVYANMSDGILSSGSDSNAFLNDDIYSNGWGYGTFGNNDGIELSSSDRNLLRGNRIYCTRGAGVFMTPGSFNIVEGNEVFRNSEGFLSNGTPTSNFFLSNVVHGNGSHAFSARGFNNVYGHNQAFANADGFVQQFTSGVSGGTLLVANDIYASGAGGSALFGLGTTTDTLVVGGHLGYDASGNSFPDPNLEINAFGTAGFTLRDCQVNPAVGRVNGVAMSAGNFVLSYNENHSTGTVRLYGDYTLAGSMTMDQAQPLYASTATAPVRLRGAGHSAKVTAAFDAAALSQVVSVRFDGSVWQVEGAVSGHMGSFSGSIVSPQGFPAGSPQFSMTFTAGPSPAAEDRVAFVLLAASPDQNVQKKLLFVTASGMLPRMTVAPSGSFTLRGSSSTYAVMDMAAPNGSNFFTFSSSGAFSVINSTVNNSDANGLQLSGTAGVLFSSMTFDNIGANLPARTYLTLRDLTSNATFYNVGFQVSRSTAGALAAYNLRVAGNDGALLWNFAGPNGPMAGDDFDDDPHRRIFWPDATPPSAVLSPAAAPGGSEGEILLGWTAPGDDGNAGTIDGGRFRIFYSSNPADMPGAAPGQAQVSFSTSGVVPGSTRFAAFGGLLLETSYYFKAWASDEWGNTPSLAGGATAQAQRYAPQPASGMTAAASVGQIHLNWTAPSLPPSPYLLQYNLFVSSVSQASGYVPLAALPAAATTYLHTGLAPSVSYYYRLETEDVASFVSIPASAFAFSPDASPPADVADLAAALGTGVGDVLLTWSAPGDNGGAAALAGGSLYRIQYTTDVAGVTWSVAGAQVSIPAGPAPAGAPQSAVISGLSGSDVYYFRLWSADPNLNFSGPSSPVAAVMPRQAGPLAAPVAPANVMGVSRGSSLTVVFDKPIQPATAFSGITLLRVRDNLGRAVSQPVGGFVSADPSSSIFTLTPSTGLAGNSRYVLVVATSVLDGQGNPLQQAASSQFDTLMDRTEDNLFDDGSLRAYFPAGALPADGYAATAALPASQAASATAKLAANTGDGLRRPVGAGLIDVKVRDDLGLVQAAPFALPVTVTLPYADAGDDGIVDGTNPPALAKTLSLHWLDEVHQVWVKLPSMVDFQAHTVTAQAPHFTTFALLAQSDQDLSGAYAFPTPFRPARGDAAVTFSGIGQFSTVRLYTVSGRLVWERQADGSGQTSWDGRTLDGDPAASGVYLYRVTNGGARAAGKLAVVR